MGINIYQALCIFVGTIQTKADLQHLYLKILKCLNCHLFSCQFLLGAFFMLVPPEMIKNFVREVLNLAPKNLGFDEIILWTTNLPVPLAPSVLLRQTNNHLRLILFTQAHHPENCFFILILHPVVIEVFCQIVVILLQWFELALGFVVYVVIILWHCSDLTWPEVIFFV